MDRRRFVVSTSEPALCDAKLKISASSHTRKLRITGEIKWATDDEQTKVIWALSHHSIKHVDLDLDLDRSNWTFHTYMCIVDRSNWTFHTYMCIVDLATIIVLATCRVELLGLSGVISYRDKS